MEKIEEMISGQSASEESLMELKTWLFQENIRLVTAAAELKEKQEQFEREKSQFREEMKDLNRRMGDRQRQIRKDNELVEKRLEIIKDGFRKLDMDRRKLEKEWGRLSAEKELMEERGYYDYGAYPEASILFRGVKNPLMLKKRYKDLTKMFHPDNVAGDTQTLQRINREYERLKKEYEQYRQA